MSRHVHQGCTGIMRRSLNEMCRLSGRHGEYSISASQIAAELGGITRNAVIGKVHRLGLSGRAKSTSNASPRPRKPRSASHMLRIGRAAIRGNTALAHAYDFEFEAEPELIENVIP